MQVFVLFACAFLLLTHPALSVKSGEGSEQHRGTSQQFCTVPPAEHPEPLSNGHYGDKDSGGSGSPRDDTDQQKPPADTTMLGVERFPERRPTKKEAKKAKKAWKAWKAEKGKKDKDGGKPEETSNDGTGTRTVTSKNKFLPHSCRRP